MSSHGDLLVIGARLLPVTPGTPDLGYTERGWMLVELSVETRLGRVFLSNLENGKHEPKLGTIKKLAKAFGLTASQLLRGI